MSIETDILQAINTMIDKKLSAYNRSATYYIFGRVTAIDTTITPHTYTVTTGECVYTGVLARSGLSFAVNDIVQICVPNGDLANKFIDKAA